MSDAFVGLMCVLIGGLFWYLSFGVFGDEMGPSIMFALLGGVCIGTGIVRMIAGD